MNAYPLIYVAGPYRAKTREGVELNIQSARKVGSLACQKGWAALIPHTATGGLDLVLPDAGDEFWLAATMQMLRQCEAVVLCPGWSFSAGTLEEIEEAKRLGLPVFKSVDELPTPHEYGLERGEQAVPFPLHVG